MNRKAAFTLIEMLITLAVTAMVSLVSTSSLIISGRLQGIHKQAVNMERELTGIQDFVANDVEKSVQVVGANLDGAGIALRIFNLSPMIVSGDSFGESFLNYPSDTLLAVAVPGSNEDGSIAVDPNLAELRLYCAAPLKDQAGQILGKRLARFILADHTLLPQEDQLVGLECQTDKIKLLFGLPAAYNLEPQYLSETAIQANYWRFRPIWLADLAVGQFYDFNPPAVQSEIGAVYNIGNGSVTASQASADEIAGRAAQLVQQRLFRRCMSSSDQLNCY